MRCQIIYLFFCLCTVLVFTKAYSQDKPTTPSPKGVNTKNSLAIQSRLRDIDEALNDNKEEESKLKDDLANIDLAVSDFDFKSQATSTDLEKYKNEAIKTFDEKKQDVDKLDDTIYMPFSYMYNKYFDDISRISYAIRKLSEQSKSIYVKQLANKLEKTSIRKFIDPNFSNNEKVTRDRVWTKLNEIYTLESINSVKAEIKEAIDKTRADINDKIKSIQLSNDDLSEERASMQELANKKNETNETIFQWGFPAFIIFILCLYLIPLFLFKYRPKPESGKESEEAAIYAQMYGTGLVTEIITVFLLTSTILLLGLTEKLTGDILGTLIGGISGYILGRSFKASRSPGSGATGNT